MVLQSQNLEKDFNYLQESIDSRLVHFFSALLQLKQDENSDLTFLNEIIKSEEYEKLSNYPSTIKITYFSEKLAEKGLDKYKIEELATSYEEQFANTLDDFAKLYQQIQIFLGDLATLRSIIPNETIEVDETGLLKQANELIAIAAERFYKERPQALPPVAEADSFMKLAEQYAIDNFGVVDRQKGKNSGTEKTNTTRHWALNIYTYFWPSKSVIGAEPKVIATTKSEQSTISPTV